MKILITGAAGFGASGLVKKCLDAGYQVTALDIVGPLEADKLAEVIHHPRLTYQWMALQDIRPDQVTGHDAVVHLAAQADVPMGFGSPRWTVEQNVMGTVNLLETIRLADQRPTRVIYAGTAHELESDPPYLPMDENLPLAPATPYGFSKAAGELAMWAWHRSYGIPITIMSNGVVIGPGMRKQIVFYFWLKAIAAGEPVILEGGQQGRDVTYVTDVVDAWWAALHAPATEIAGEKFQVSYGEEHTMTELLEMCFQVVGRRVPVIRKPYRLGEEGMRELFSIAKAQRVLGYQPRVNAEDALRRTWAWIQEGH